MVIARRQRETQRPVTSAKIFSFFFSSSPTSFHLAGWPAPTWPGSSHSVREFIPERRRSATPTTNLYRKNKNKKSATRGRVPCCCWAHKRHLRITHTHTASGRIMKNHHVTGSLFVTLLAVSLVSFFFFFLVPKKNGNDYFSFFVCLTSSLIPLNLLNMWWPRLSGIFFFSGRFFACTHIGLNIITWQWWRHPLSWLIIASTIITKTKLVVVNFFPPSENFYRRLYYLLPDDPLRGEIGTDEWFHSKAKKKKWWRAGPCGICVLTLKNSLRQCIVFLIIALSTTTHTLQYTRPGSQATHKTPRSILSTLCSACVWAVCNVPAARRVCRHCVQLLWLSE